MEKNRGILVPRILQKATKRLSGNGGRFLLLSAWRGKDVQYGKGK